MTGVENKIKIFKITSKDCNTESDQDSDDHTLLIAVSRDQYR